MKARLGTLSGAKAAKRRTVADLARIGPGTAKAGLRGPMGMEAKKKGEATAVIKQEKHRHKRQAKKNE